MDIMGKWMDLGVSLLKFYILNLRLSLPNDESLGDVNANYPNLK